MKKILCLPLLIWGIILLAGCFNKSDPLIGQVQSILDSKITLALANNVIKDSQVIELNGKEKAILADSATKILIEKNGKTREAKIDDIQTGDILSVIVDEDNKTAIKIGLKNDWTAQSNSEDRSKQISLSGRYVVSDELIESAGETFDSTYTDENSILIEDNGVLNASNAAITKSGDTTSEKESRLYGVNNAVVAISGSAGNLEGSSIQSEAEGGNAIFASGKDSIIRLFDTSILTTGGSAKGLYATNQGAITGQDISITTEGAHSAAAVADGKNSSVTLYDTTLTTASKNSPCLYSAGAIKAIGVLGLANASSAAILEGKSILSISSSDLTGTGNYGILMHGSHSSEEGLASFSAIDSLLSATQDEAMFYVTRTDVEASISNTELCFESGVLIKAQKSGNIAFKAYKQTLTGDIICDDTSTVSLELREDSFYKGAVDTDNQGSAILVLEKSSTWSMTEDSYISILSNEQLDCRNIQSNGHTLFYDAEEEENGWLNGDTHTLPGGGKLTPAP